MSTAYFAVVDHNTGFLLHLSEKESREAAIYAYLEMVDFYLGGPLRAVELSDDQAYQVADWWGDDSLTIDEWMRGQKYDYPRALRSGVMYGTDDVRAIAGRGCH